MNKSRMALAVLVLTVVAQITSGCSRPGAAEPQATIRVEVDTISRTSSQPEEIEALDACWITDSKHQLVSTIAFDRVSGAGKVTPARAVPSVVPLFGTEPQIQTDGPAWVFTISGEIVLPPDVLERDPTCVVVNGFPVWYSTGASYIDGEWIEASRPSSPLSATLPPLAP